MNRIGICLNGLKESGRKALVTYIVHGDPRPQTTLTAMNALVDSGVDIIELGVPFSDPMAEGPVIAKGHERALEHNVSLKSTLELVKQFRASNQDTPIVLMGYANPIERMGYEAFAQAAADAGVDGVLTVDLPAEESGAFTAQLKAKGLENIFLIAPTTTEERIQKVCSQAGGFIYYVSLKGVTGAGHLDIDAVKERVSTIQKYTSLPLLVGFGIKDAQTASAIGSTADGVVVGSVLVKTMGDMHAESDDAIADALKQLVMPMRTSLNDLS